MRTVEFFLIHEANKWAIHIEALEPFDAGSKPICHSGQPVSHSPVDPWPARG